MPYHMHISGYSEPIRCLLKNIAIHMGTNRVAHAQFLQLDPNRDYRIHVPVHLRGEEECVGTKQGGFLLQPTSLLDVVFRTSIAARMGVFSFPTALFIHVSDLNIEATIHAQDIALPAFLEIASDRAKRHVLVTFTKNFG
uniref:50S ribosomal protein L25 n=1 Tax=Lygus hesperus TaxID=30085 RepID=A0A0A9VYC3_LYGHE